MALAFSSIYSSFLVLVTFLAVTNAINNNHLNSSLTSHYPKLQAKRLIRDLNLFPEANVNVAASKPHIAPTKIVEKRFKFPVHGISGPIQELGHHAGYYQLSHSHNARMFYLFFKSQNSKKNDPVVIWLTGGPGCGSEIALFYENGPYQISNNSSLVWNDYSCGFAIGNGLTDPAIQYTAYTDYALSMGLINQTDYDRINKLLPECEKSIQTCGTKGGGTCKTSFKICNKIFDSIINVTGNINYYDIRKQRVGNKCYDFSNLEKFLNQNSVRDALRVGDKQYVSCSAMVYKAMIDDWMKNLEVSIPALLEDGIKVLVYAGEYDLVCNWLGNSRWARAMKWSGQRNFSSSPTVPFIVDGTEAGLLKSYEPLAFLKVYNAGHMVPMDQPKAALEMLRSWMQGNLATSQKPDRNDLL